MNKINLIKQYMTDIEDALLIIRRHLHAFPELSKQEIHSSKYVARQLEAIPGLEVTRGLAHGTGVMATLKGTRPLQDGERAKCVLLRADIDALPVTEDNNLEFKSQNPGVMHACGHDSHATWVIGAAMILSKMRDEFAGTVKFVFQPGEEVGFGAREMVYEDHILENPTVDYAFAAHNWPLVDRGKVGINRRYAYGCPGGFSVNIIGRGGHGSWPEYTVNPIIIASHIIAEIEDYVEKIRDELSPKVISTCMVNAGTAGNIIPDEATISGTIRAVEKTQMDELIAHTESIVKKWCDKYGATYEFTGHCHDTGVLNAPELIELVRASAADIVGDNNAYIIERDNLGGENFSVINALVPSVYFFVGNADPNGKWMSLHSSRYMLDEEVLSRAAGVFTNIVLRILGGDKWN